MFGMNWRFEWVAVGVALGLIAGCGGGSSVLDTVYVDVANTGPEDGSQAHPYNTIEEGLSSVAEGGTVVIAQGTYPCQSGGFGI